MPPLADRENFEASIIAGLAPIFQAEYQRAIAAPGPSIVPYGDFQADLQRTMQGELFDVFEAAGTALMIGNAIVLSQGAFEETARRWSEGMSRELAAQVVETSQRMTADAFQLAGGDREKLTQALSLVYMADARLRAIAVTEVTRGVSAGEHGVVIPFNNDIRRQGRDDDGRLLVPIWQIDPRSDVCEHCLPLDGHSREVWGLTYPWGPPGHIHCACHLLWVTLAEFARGGHWRHAA